MQVDLQLCCSIMKRSAPTGGFQDGPSMPVAPHEAGGTSDDDGLTPDVSDDALQMHINRKKGVGSWYPSGPSSLEEVLDWCPLGMQSLGRFDRCQGTQLMEELQNTFQEVIVFWSCYSGTGMAEAAAATIYHHVQRSMGVMATGTVMVWSVTDKDPHAQKILSEHTGISKSRHRFLNVLDRLFEADRD